jgi:hypothetical protein
VKNKETTTVPFPVFGGGVPMLPQRRWTRATDFVVREKGEKLTAISNFVDRAYFLKTGERLKIS